MFTTESYWRIPGKFREILKFTDLNRVNFREMAFAMIEELTRAAKKDNMVKSTDWFE